MARAVMAIIGKCSPLISSICRMAAVAEKPSISGICKSMSTKSNRCIFKAFSARAPLSTAMTVCPCFSKMPDATR